MRHLHQLVEPAPAHVARLRYPAEHLHGLGPRPLFEFLREIVDDADPMERLERYTELDPRSCASSTTSGGPNNQRRITHEHRQAEGRCNARTNSGVD